MNFLKIEWTKKRGVIALLATGLIVTSFVLGGYVATGSWNPWGHRHYYQNLDVNFGYCVAGSQNFCNSVKVDIQILVECLRSEEHTSELQSLRHLVCRLLLEKKNTSQR